MSRRKKKKEQAFVLVLCGMIVLVFGIMYITGFFSKEVPDKNEAAEEEVVPKSVVNNKPKNLSEYKKQCQVAVDDGDFPGRMNVPILFQKEKQWSQTQYGFGDDDNTIGVSGCALASLAMVDGFLRQKEVTPLDVRKWSGDRYYEQGAGTSWRIFQDYANHVGVSCEEIGVDSDRLLNHLKADHPVIVSVKPGTFTEVGHIMVVTGVTNDNQLYVNDPNDNQTKEHFFKTYPLDELLSESLNFWAFAP